MSWMVSPWQHIDSAPKDGTHILAWDNRDMETVFWWKSEIDGRGYWSLVFCGAYAEDGEWWPTYWTRLPIPPNEHP